MNILEKDIEDLVWGAMSENPEILQKIGFPLPNGYKYFRQPNFGHYGIADLVGVRINRESVHIIIYELKKDEINTGTFLQAIRYGKAIKEIYLKSINRYCSISYVLIGKSVDTKGDFCYITDAFHNVDYYTYSLDLITGLKFNKRQGYYNPGGRIPESIFTISSLKSIING